MTFLFVDRLLDITNAAHLVGLKHVTSTDVFFEQADDGRYYLQDAIVGETLGQLAAWYVMRSCNFQFRPVAGIVESVIITGHAYLGDTIHLHAHLEHLDDQSVKYRAAAIVNGRVICELRDAVGPMVPLNEFSCPEKTLREFTVINRPGELAHGQLGRVLMHTAPAPSRILASQHDSIVMLQRREVIQAHKAISLSAPYFPDHFGRNPVFPMSLLLQCHTALARDFIEQGWGSDAAHFRLSAINKIKMKHFIRPGDITETTLSLKEETQDTLTLACVTSVEGKRLFTASLVFCRDNEA